jgi:hypothetical protein
LGAPDIAAMVKHGERRRLMLSNKAISAYERFRAEQKLSLAS